MPEDDIDGEEVLVGRLLELLGRLYDIVRDAPRREYTGNPFLHPFGIMMQATTTGLYGVRTLVHYEFGSEAAMVARSMFENSLRLQKVAESPEEDRIRYGAQALTQAVHEGRSTAQAARDAGILTELAYQQHVKKLDEETRRQHDSVKQHLSGDRAIGRINVGRDLAAEFGRESDWYAYTLSTQIVHGNIVGYRDRVTVLDPASMEIGTRSSVWMVALSAQLAISSYTLAHESVQAILNIEPIAGIGSLKTEFDEFLAEAAAYFSA